MKVENGWGLLVTYVKSRDKTPLTCCEVCIKNEREGRIVTERERERERRGGVASLTILERCLGSVSFPSPEHARREEEEEKEECNLFYRDVGERSTRFD